MAIFAKSSTAQAARAHRQEGRDLLREGDAVEGHEHEADLRARQPLSPFSPFDTRRTLVAPEKESRQIQGF